MQFHLKNVLHILTTLLQKVTSIDLANGIIHVHGLDLLEGTPVLGERIEELWDVKNRGQSTTVLVSHTVNWRERVRKGERELERNVMGRRLRELEREEWVRDRQRETKKYRKREEMRKWSRNSTRGCDNEDEVRRNGDRKKVRGEGKKGKKIKTKER